MAYTPDPTNVTEPADSEKAKTAAAEFRALKAYLATTIIAGLIAGKVAKTGDTMTGLLVSDVLSGEALRIISDAGYISGYKDDGSARLGYLQFNTSGGGSVLLTTDNAALLRLRGAGTEIDIAGNVMYPLAAASVALGSTTQRWSALWAVAGEFSGNVTAATFTGSGAGLTGIPAPSGAAIVAALGYTPANVAGNIATASKFVSTRPLYQAHRSASDTYTSGVATRVAFDVEDVDAGGNGASGTFTAPVAGVYEVSWSCNFDASGSVGILTAALRKNGSALSSIYTATAASQGTANYTALSSGRRLITLAASDTLDIYMSRPLGANVNVNDSTFVVALLQ